MTDKPWWPGFGAAIAALWDSPKPPPPPTPTTDDIEKWQLMRCIWGRQPMVGSVSDGFETVVVEVQSSYDIGRYHHSITARRIHVKITTYTPAQKRLATLGGSIPYDYWNVPLDNRIESARAWYGLRSDILRFVYDKCPLPEPEMALALKAIHHLVRQKERMPWE
jgi:hypothetical protein